MFQDISHILDDKSRLCLCFRVCFQSSSLSRTPMAEEMCFRTFHTHSSISHRGHHSAASGHWVVPSPHIELHFMTLFSFLVAFFLSFSSLDAKPSSNHLSLELGFQSSCTSDHRSHLIIDNQNQDSKARSYPIN